MAEWVAVCRLDELREGRGVSLDAAGLRVAVFRARRRGRRALRALPAFRRFAGPGLDRGGRGGLPAAPLAVPAGRRALHDHPGQAGAPVPLRGPGR